jgi:DNA-binding NarL/FixJ family response regulator
MAPDREGLKMRVLIADDQQMVRAGLRMILEHEPDVEVVGEAGDGTEALELARRMRPDVVLMDIRMPRMDGLEATRNLLSQPGIATRVLILTTFEIDEYVFEAIRAGASGFLLKTAPPADLVHAVRVVAAGDALLSPSITRQLIGEFARLSRRPVESPPEVASLTEREAEVLKLVAAGLSNAEIAKGLFLGEATIKTHLGRVLDKLGLRDRVQAVIYAYEHGLVEPGWGPAGNADQK